MKIDNLTDTQKVAKIAEACGKHQYFGILRLGSRCSVCEKDYGEDCHRVPDYLNDLNAIHEAEKVLTRAQRESRNIHLWRIVLPYNARAPWDLPKNQVELTAMVDATARQHADAMLLTLPEPETEPKCRHDWEPQGTSSRCRKCGESVPF